jgi:hypothetical protein
MTENTPTKKDKPEPRRLDGKPKTRRVGQIIARGPNKWLTRIFRGYKTAKTTTSTKHSTARRRTRKSGCAAPWPGGVFAAFLLWAGTRPNEANGLQL